jgi:hypothetical protein
MEVVEVKDIEDLKAALVRFHNTFQALMVATAHLPDSLEGYQLIHYTLTLEQFTVAATAIDNGVAEDQILENLTRAHQVFEAHKQLITIDVGPPKG